MEEAKKRVATSSGVVEHLHSLRRMVAHVLGFGDEGKEVLQRRVCHELHVHSHMGHHMERRHRHGRVEGMGRHIGVVGRHSRRVRVVGHEMVDVHTGRHDPHSNREEESGGGSRHGEG